MISGNSERFEPFIAARAIFNGRVRRHGAGRQQLAGAAVDPPWQDFVIGCLADRNEALVLRSVGSVKVDFVPCGAQAAAKHVAVRLHSAPEGFGDGMADMGEDRDLHARNDALCDMIEKRP